jgi:uncharacterized protein (DUF488 family)
MIYTFGYSKWTLAQVIGKMEEKGIDLLVDVRSVPFGRFREFNRNNLEKVLGAHYLWKGDVLGGKFGPCTEEGIGWLAREERSLLIMCVEWDPCRCHRLLDIGTRLLTRGVNAIHLLHDGTEHTTEEYLGRPHKDIGRLQGISS